MQKLKLMTIVGTRPEIIRLAAVIKKCDKYFDQTLVHTGQNYDYTLNGIFFEDLELRQPDVYLDAAGADLGETIGNIIAKSYKLMAERKPDALLILGDTNSCLSAISAKRLHIPIFHMEAGNRCFDECLPEETNRRIVDHIADVNLCYSEHARRYLNAEGTAKERTYVTGSPMAEVLRANLARIEASDILTRLGLEPHKYMLLSAHREENIDTEKNFVDLFTSINALAEKYDMPILYSCHPRSRKRLEAMGFRLDERVRLHEPLGFHDYNHLQMNAFCVVSDSGTLPEESSFFTSVGHPFPAVCIRTSTERPEALDKGCFILAGIAAGGVEQAVETAVAMNENGDIGIPVPYYTEDVSTKVVKIIQSYVGVVNKMVWRKSLMARLLVVTQHFWPENFRINDMVRGLIDDGVEVDVLCGLPNYPKGEWFAGYRYTGPRRETWQGAQLFRAGEVRRKGNTSLRIFLNYVSWPFFALFSLWRLPGGYDGILCYNTSPVLMSFPALVYGKLHRVPVTNYVLDIWPENLYSVLPVKSRFWRRVADAVSDWHYRQADKLIAMSDGLRARLLARTGKAEQDVAVIPQYCEDFYAVPGPCEELRERFAGRFNLVFTGNFSPAQALPTVIRAAGRARAAGAERLHLLLVGDGMSRPDLEALVRSEGLEDLVTFWGSVPPEQVPRFTALADGLVASLNDSPDLGLTVPAKIASYMAAGKPVLASMNGEGAAAVEMSGGGWASPACDEAALAQNMLRLYRLEPDARARMGRAAFAWYEGHYTRAALLAQLERFILE